VSKRQSLPSFYNLHKLRGGAVCKAEIVRGIGKALGMEVLVPKNATGDVDTDLFGKAEATLELLEQYDFVVAHFNGTDEAAHRYDALEKVAFIERIDKEFLGTVLNAVQEPLKIVICGDHVTSSVTGKHDGGVVPVLAWCSEHATKKLENYQDIIKFLMKECD
ncbi:MAG: alkaline phosphatase family protein, partial [Phascolarctobacterium sp.]|nr:alkaline phosphatase family protein [Phascolarctobacterium sp.]